MSGESEKYPAELIQHDVDLIQEKLGFIPEWLGEICESNTQLRKYWIDTANQNQLLRAEAKRVTEVCTKLTEALKGEQIMREQIEKACLALNAENEKLLKKILELSKLQAAVKVPVYVVGKSDNYFSNN